MNLSLTYTKPQDIVAGVVQLARHTASQKTDQGRIARLVSQRGQCTAAAAALTEFAETLEKVKLEQQGDGKLHFTVEITLGNEAMQEYEDVKQAIIRSLNEFGHDAHGTRSPVKVGTSRVIRDTNGNKVGAWKVEGAQ